MFHKLYVDELAPLSFTMLLRAVAAYEANEAEASLDFQTFFEGPPNFLGATKIFGGHQNIKGLEGPDMKFIFLDGLICS